MSKQYARTVILTLNGVRIRGIKGFREPNVSLWDPVDTMDDTGAAEKTARYKDMEIDYIVPVTDPEYDWEAVNDARLTVEYPSGKRHTYTGVYPSEVGGAKLDGEGDAIREVKLFAADRIKE